MLAEAIVLIPKSANNGTEIQMDVLPLVLCKDCKYWSAERINDFNKCRRWINVGVKNFATMGDWFCADGERKDS